MTAWAETFTLTFNQHGKLAGHLVILDDPQGTMFAHQGTALPIEAHGHSRRWTPGAEDDLPNQSFQVDGLPWRIVCHAVTLLALGQQSGELVAQCRHGPGTRGNQRADAIGKRRLAVQGPVPQPARDPRRRECIARPDRVDHLDRRARVVNHLVGGNQQAAPLAPGDAHRIHVEPPPDFAGEGDVLGRTGARSSARTVTSWSLSFTNPATASDRWSTSRSYHR